MKYMTLGMNVRRARPPSMKVHRSEFWRSSAALKGSGEVFFLDILFFHRMSVMAMISAAIAQELFRNIDAKHANIATTAAIAAARKPGVVRSVSASVNRPPVSVGRRNRSLAFSAANSFSSCDTRRS